MTMPVQHWGQSKVMLGLCEQILCLQTCSSRSWVAGPKQHVSKSGAPLRTEVTDYFTQNQATPVSRVSRSFILNFQTAEPNTEHTWEPQPFWIGCDESGIFLNQYRIPRVTKNGRLGNCSLSHCILLRCLLPQISPHWTFPPVPLVSWPLPERPCG